MTVSELKATLRERAFPEGIAPEQEPAVYSWLREGFIDLQSMCKNCLQTNHADVQPFASTYWKCGTSVICKPPGIIKRVYTVSSEFCQPVDYVQWDYQYIRQWSRLFARRSGVPDNTGLPSLQLGLKYPKNSTDHRQGNILRPLWGRSPVGNWAIENNNLIVAPWIQEKESIVIEWSGLKRDWTDADIVSSGHLPEDRWLNAMFDFVLAQKADRFDADYTRADRLMASYDTKLAELAAECRRLTENIYPSEANLRDRREVERADAIDLRTEQQDGTVDTSGAVVETPMIFGVIGDYGLPGADELAVSTLVKSWDPAFVLTTGDNDYPDGAAGTIDAAVGQYYRKFLYPYKGTYPLLDGEEDATTNKFWPTLGNHDLDSGFPPTAYTDYFTLGGIGGRIYSFVSGLCEFFCIDSGINTAGDTVEILGNTKIDFSAMWLQSRLAASTAKFKVVWFHHPPYTSDENYWPGIAALRWDFKKWGADVVFNGHGHNSEVVVVDGMTYVITGTGGAELRCFHDPPVDGSEWRDCEHFGAVKVSVVCAAMTIEFFDVDGTLLHTVTITNDNPANMSTGTGVACQCVSTTVVQNQGFLPAETLAIARMLPALATNKVLIVAGRDAPGDGGGSAWTWNAASLDADDGRTVLKPNQSSNATPGRWWILFGG